MKNVKEIIEKVTDEIKVTAFNVQKDIKKALEDALAKINDTTVYVSQGCEDDGNFYEIEFIIRDDKVIMPYWGCNEEVMIDDIKEKIIMFCVNNADEYDVECIEELLKNPTKTLIEEILYYIGDAHEYFLEQIDQMCFEPNEETGQYCVIRTNYDKECDNLIDEFDIWLPDFM